MLLCRNKLLPPIFFLVHHIYKSIKNSRAVLSLTLLTLINMLFPVGLREHNAGAPGITCNADHCLDCSAIAGIGIQDITEYNHRL